MTRRLIPTLGGLLLAVAPAVAQEPNPLRAPLPPPPQLAPPPQPLPPPQPPGATGTPRLDTFSDMVSRCIHYGSAAGVPPGQIGQYTRECVNSQ